MVINGVYVDGTEAAIPAGGADVWTKSVERFYGTPFHDVFRGSNTVGFFELFKGGNDIVYGGDGGDMVRSDCVGQKTIRLGAGTDTMSYAGCSVGMQVNLTNNSATHGILVDELYDVENVVGSNASDVIIGNSGNNVLEGGPGDDKLFGADGDDIMSGGLGNNFLDGGNGIDTVTFFGAKGVKVSLANGTAKGANRFDELKNIENVYGSEFNDVLEGSSANNQLYGGGGDDTLISGKGGINLLNGGDGHDLYIIQGGSNMVVTISAHSTVDTVRLVACEGLPLTRVRRNADLQIVCGDTDMVLGK